LPKWDPPNLCASIFIKPEGDKTGRNQKVIRLRVRRPKPTLLPAPVLIKPKGDKDGWC
jgi:hypothetical protein